MSLLHILLHLHNGLLIRYYLNAVMYVSTVGGSQGLRTPGMMLVRQLNGLQSLQIE